MNREIHCADFREYLNQFDKGTVLFEYDGKSLTVSKSLTNLSHKTVTIFKTKEVMQKNLEFDRVEALNRDKKIEAIVLQSITKLKNHKFRQQFEPMSVPKFLELYDNEENIKVLNEFHNNKSKEAFTFLKWIEGARANKDFKFVEY